MLDVVKAFANDLQANIKLSKTQISKSIQSGGFITTFMRFNKTSMAKNQI